MSLNLKNAKSALVPMLLASTMVAFSPAASAQDARPGTLPPQGTDNNIAEYPNIFRAFEENVDGIEGLSEIDAGGMFSINGTPVQADISRFPTVDRDTTLWGEFDTVSWPFYMTASDIANPVKINIAFQNAASVMPENSTLDLLVNGVKVGESIIQSPASTGQISVEIPPNSLLAGYNAISVVARQYHRVDCSADATYELWTRIDVENSTIEYVGNRDRIRSFKDLAGIAANRNQALPVFMHYPATQPMTPWDARSSVYFNLVQKASIVRGLRKTDVNVARLEQLRDHDAALDVFAGTLAELNETPTISRLYDLSDISAQVNSATSNTVFITSRSKRRTLMLRLSEIAHLPEGFDAAWSSPVEGSPLGVSLVRQLAYQEYEDTTVSLRELGYVENELVGRRFNAKFGFRLPADFFPGSYDEIALHLFGVYSSGLKDGQRLLIRINGQSEVSLPLNGARGGTFEDKIVQLDLARFQPGYNEIEITAFLEKPSDDVCLPGGERDMEPRFFLASDSFITVPKLAKLGRFPNVGATIGTGFPYRAEDGRGHLDVVLADDRPETLSKAVEFVSALASQTDYIYGVQPSVMSAVAQQGFSFNRVIVGNYSVLPAQYAQRVNGADVATIAAYWNNPGSSLAGADIDRMKTAALGDSSAGQPLNLQGSIPSGSAMDLLGRDTTGQGGGLGLRERFQRQAQERRESSGFQLFVGQLKSVLMAPVRAFLPKEFEPEVVANNAPALVSQIVEGETVTTVVGFAETDTAAAEIAGFFKPTSYRSDLVQTAGLNLADPAVTSVVVQRPQFSIVTDWSMRNVRLIIAGWLSNNPAVFGVLALAMFLLAGSISNLALRRTQRVYGETFEPLNM